MSAAAAINLTLWQAELVRSLAGKSIWCADAIRYKIASILADAEADDDATTDVEVFADAE